MVIVGLWEIDSVYLVHGQGVCFIVTVCAIASRSFYTRLTPLFYKQVDL